jgi:signal transduction histidine kinase
MAHESSLVQALSNLISNAVKFVPPQTLPKVTIRAEPCGQNVRLWVTDNGIGIKPEYQSRLFGMFERLKTESIYEGTGIGLAIVRKAAEKMGGTVGFESDGSTTSSFWIELPGVPSDSMAL